MTRFGVLGATALSLSLAIATPVLAQQAPGSKAGAHAAAGARMSGPRMQSNFRGAQGNVGAANFAGRGPRRPKTSMATAAAMNNTSSPITS